MSITQWAVCRRSASGVWLPETGTVRSKCMEAISAWSHLLGERNLLHYQASFEAGEVKAMRVEVSTMRGEGEAPRRSSESEVPTRSGPGEEEA